MIGICSRRIAVTGGNADVRFSNWIVTIGKRPAVFRNLQGGQWGAKNRSSPREKTLENAGNRQTRRCTRSILSGRDTRGLQADETVGRIVQVIERL